MIKLSLQVRQSWQRNGRFPLINPPTPPQWSMRLRNCIFRRRAKAADAVGSLYVVNIRRWLVKKHFAFSPTLQLGTAVERDIADTFNSLYLIQNKNAPEKFFGTFLFNVWFHSSANCRKFLDKNDAISLWFFIQGKRENIFTQFQIFSHFHLKIDLRLTISTDKTYARCRRISVPKGCSPVRATIRLG